METQVGHLTLAFQNKSRYSFPSDTKKNPKEFMVIKLWSGRDLNKREEEERKLIGKGQ